MARKRGTVKKSSMISKISNACASKTCRCHLTHTERLSIVFGMVGAVGATVAFWAMSLHFNS